jgi:hypothetical protein
MVYTELHSVQQHAQHSVQYRLQESEWCILQYSHSAAHALVQHLLAGQCPSQLQTKNLCLVAQRMAAIRPRGKPPLNYTLHNAKTPSMQLHVR